MSKAVIENYRGFNIEFDTDYEKFQCVITEDMTKESLSYSAIKKWVDEYKKNNQDFDPFWIEGKPESWKRSEKLKVIGLRKDGRPVAVKEDGTRVQISDYDSSEYMIAKIENIYKLKALNDLETENEKIRTKFVERRKAIISSMDIVSLKEHLKSLK